MTRNPFEQFEIVSIIGVITNSSIIIVISMFVIGVWMWSASVSKRLVIPSRYGIMLEKCYMLVVGMVNDSMSKKGERMLSVMLTLFISIVVLNVIGIIPYSYTVTSQLIVTLMLSTGVWVGKLIIGVRLHGIKLLGMFIPAGLPIVMVPFFVVIEVIGFVIPLISLSVRLFANMLSGHVLLKVLFGFTWGMWFKGGMVTIMSVLPLGALMLLLGLEIGVAVIQGFVFTLLTSIYVGDMISGGH